MILSSLTNYYGRLKDNGEVPPVYHTTRPIHLIIGIDGEGNLVNIYDNRDEKSKASLVTTPTELVRTSKPEGNLLFDNSKYTLGIDRKHEAFSQKHLDKFIEKLHQFYEQTENSVAWSILQFYEKQEYLKVPESSGWKEYLKSLPEKDQNTDPYTVFAVNDASAVTERAEVIEDVIKFLSAQEKEANPEGICLVTGEQAPISATHGNVKGVAGTRGQGAPFVSYNQSAFSSYGIKQGFNAPIGAEASYKFTTSANTLLRSKNQKARLQDSTLIFWTSQKSEAEDNMMSLFDSPEDTDEAAAYVKKLINAAQTGALPTKQEGIRYNLLSLGGNVGRLAVKAFYEGDLQDLEKNVAQHLQDIDIGSEFQRLKLKTMIYLTMLPCGGKQNKKLASALESSMLEAIVNGSPYPKRLFTLAAIALTKQFVNSEQTIQSGKNRGKPKPANITTQLGVVKAYLNRKYRRRGEKELSVGLDIENSNPHYLCGRLFAAIEKTQRDLSPDLNRTIGHRYRGAALHPQSVITPLLSLNKTHLLNLKKSNPGFAINLEKTIGEIMTKLPGLPKRSNIEEQAIFSLGYWQQMQAFYVKSEE